MWEIMVPAVTSYRVNFKFTHFHGPGWDSSPDTLFSLKENKRILMSAQYAWILVIEVSFILLRSHPPKSKWYLNFTKLKPHDSILSQKGEEKKCNGCKTLNFHLYIRNRRYSKIKVSKHNLTAIKSRRGPYNKAMKYEHTHTHKYIIHLLYYSLFTQFLFC